MYGDIKTAQHRLGRTTQVSKTLTAVLVLLATALFIGAMHGDYMALQAGIIN